jgi:hypothetical protein
MVKAASSAGPSGKLKHRRRGANKKSKGSLKHQLRGLERLLDRAAGDEHRRALQGRIDELRGQRQAWEEREAERQHARQSHGTRFLERQRLTRMLKRVEDAEGASDTKAGADAEASRYRLALDQAYVGHFPHDQKYLKLFRSGQRVVDPPRHLARRARIRARILETVAGTPSTSSPGPGATPPRVDWISPDQYARLPASWSVEDERRVFGAAGGTKANKDGPSVRDDDRFRSSDAHEKLLRAAEDAEREAEMEDVGGEGGSEDDDDDPPAPDKSSGGAAGSRPGGARPGLLRDAEKGPTGWGSDDDSSSSSDDSSTSSEGSDDEGVPAEKLGREIKGSGETPAAAKGKYENKVGGGNGGGGGGDDDDFFVEASGEEGATNPFAGAPRIKGLDEIRGDKSQGWATQRQRPGEYKSDGRRRPRPAGHRGWKKDNKRR